MGDRTERITITWAGPGTPVMESIVRIEPAGRSMEAVLDDAAPGTVVTWRSPDAPPGHLFERLESIKVGSDAFAAHGLSPARNVFSRVELAELLQAAVAPGAPPDRVFVQQIELVDLNAPPRPAVVDEQATYYLDHLEDLDEQGEPFALLGLLALGPAAEPAVRAALSSGDSVPRRLAAIHAASALRLGALSPRLMELASEDADFRLCQAAAEAIGRLGAPGALDALEVLLGHPHPNVRLGAIIGLELLGDPAAVQSLSDLLEVESDEAVAWWSGPAAGGLPLRGRLEGAIAGLTGG